MNPCEVSWAWTAIDQADLLRKFYREKERPDALRNLERSILDAERTLASAPHDGLPAPRPYPKLRHEGLLWIKSGRYWIAYRLQPTPIITAIFFDTADIPTRLAPPAQPT